MIDYFTVFTRGGLVLWSTKNQYSKTIGSTVNELIRKVIMEEKSGERSFSYNQHQLRWTFENDLELIFVVVYQQFLTLYYIEQLLQDTKKTFVNMLGGRLPDFLPTFDFTPEFDKIVEKYINESIV